MTFWAIFPFVEWNGYFKTILLFDSLNAFENKLGIVKNFHNTI